MSTSAEGRHAEAEGLGALWFGFLGAPAAWFLLLSVNYSFVRYVCASGEGWVLHAANLAALLLALAGGWVAWRSWERSGRPREASEGGVAGRTRFLALGGLVTSAFFTLMIVTTWIPNLFLHPCRGP